MTTEEAIRRCRARLALRLTDQEVRDVEERIAIRLEHLPRPPRVVVLQVAGRARVFVGEPGDTVSAYVHRVADVDRVLRRLGDLLRTKRAKSVRSSERKAA